MFAQRVANVNRMEPCMPHGGYDYSTQLSASSGANPNAFTQLHLTSIYTYWTVAPINGTGGVSDNQNNYDGDQT